MLFCYGASVLQFHTEQAVSILFVSWLYTCLQHGKCHVISFHVIPFVVAGVGPAVKFLRSSVDDYWLDEL